MIEIFLLLLCLVLLIKPLGLYFYAVYSGQLATRFAWVARAEGLLGKLIGANLSEAMTWQAYVKSLLIFLLLCFLAVYTLLVCQHWLPFNPDGFVVSPDLAFNITISFITGTNLQTYVPGYTLTAISQNFGITFLQFIAPAADMAVAVALFRAFASHSETIGNFWQDLLRSVIFILLPGVCLVSLVYLSQGMVQSLDTLHVTTLEGAAQTIPTGGVVSMQAIGQLGTSGGGYFASNAAHPFVTPTPLVAFFNRLLIMLVPAVFFYLLGMMVSDRKQGVSLLILIGISIMGLASVAVYHEQHLPHAIADLAIDGEAGNMEGKELRLGSSNAAVWAMLATSTTNGSASSSYESFEPLSILVMMIPMLFGAILLGGPGIGVINMMAMIVVTVFLASLMIGRSPEYLRKKLSVLDIQICVIIIVTPAVFLFLAMGLSIHLPEVIERMQFDGVDGYTELLYVLTSAAFNNGSSLGGIDLNTRYLNLILALGMFLNSILCKILACVLAGSIASKQRAAVNRHGLNTASITFGVLLLIVIIINTLAYLPILMLGPIATHMEAMG